MTRILQTRTALILAGALVSLIDFTASSQMPPESTKALMAGSTTPDVPSEEVQRKAATGHLREELQLAGDYYAGHGIARDLSQSAYWYRKAAEQGDPGAQVNIGYFYLRGIGVKPDAGQAAKWFQRASASGSPTGKLNLAVMYLKGVAVPQDTQLGIGMLNELVKHDDARGEAYLGLLYMVGYSVGRDPAAAERLFEKAAKHRNPEAEYALGTLFSITEGHEHDLSRAAGYFRDSAQSGYVLSKHSLGLLLVNHPELPQSPGEAKSMLEAAATGGSWRSSVLLGIIYRDGRGVPKDIATAYKWFTIAGQQGGEKVQAYVRADVVAARSALSADQRQQAENSAAEWMAANPHSDVFLLKGGSESAFFPIDEVYSTELAQMNSPDGARNH